MTWPQLIAALASPTGVCVLGVAAAVLVGVYVSLQRRYRRALRAHAQLLATLHTGEAQYHALFTALREGLVVHELIYDAAGQPIDYCPREMNAAACEMLGVRPADFLHQAMTDWRRQRYGTAELGQLTRFAAVAAGGASYTQELYHAELDRHFSLSVYSPSAGRVAVLFTDITARKQAEEALKASEETAQYLSAGLRALHQVRDQLFATQNGVAICRQAIALSHQLLGFDRLAVWMLTEEPGVLAGTYGIAEDGTLRDEQARRVCLADASPVTVALITEALAHPGQLAVREDTPLLNDRDEPVGEGTRISLALCDGQRSIGVLMGDNLRYHRPLTRQKTELLLLFTAYLGHRYTNGRMLGVLEQSEQRYRSLFEHMQEIVAIDELVLDAAGTAVDWVMIECNPAYERFFALAPAEVIGRRATAIYQGITPIAEYLARYQRVVTTGALEQFDTYFPQLDKHCRVSAFPMGGQRFAVVSADITAYKQAEAQVQAYAEELRALAQEAIVSQEHERRQLAQALHDTISQSLALAKLQLSALPVTDPLARERLDGVLALLDETVQHARTLTFALSPPILYELGLGAGLEWLAETITQQHGLPVTVQGDLDRLPLDDDTQTFLFTAAREALVNVVKHARARQATVWLRAADGRVQVEIRDDGVGFDPASLPGRGSQAGGFGLFSIRERLRHLGGRVEIVSAPGQGTGITLFLPLLPRQ